MIRLATNKGNAMRGYELLKRFEQMSEEDRYQAIGFFLGAQGMISEGFTDSKERPDYLQAVYCLDKFEDALNNWGNRNPRDPEWGPTQEREFRETIAMGPIDPPGRSAPDPIDRAGHSSGGWGGLAEAFFCLTFIALVASILWSLLAK